MLSSSEAVIEIDSKESFESLALILIWFGMISEFFALSSSLLFIFKYLFQLPQR